MKKILLGIGYAGDNEARALRTIEAFGSYFCGEPGSSYDVCLGVDTAAALRPGLDPVRHLFREIVVWDESATTEALAAVDSAPRPFYPEFSYGGLINRLLVLGGVAQCDYVLRVDPGTLPPADAGSMIARQIDSLATYRVVSGVYADRLAFRDRAYRRESTRDKYLQFVNAQTGVDIHHQLTGGALFLAATPGVPALPVAAWPRRSEQGTRNAPALVWGSDDAIYQVGGVPARVFADHRIPRHDPFGKAKQPAEYFLGVAGMAYLRRLGQGDDSRSWIPEFVAALNAFLDPSLEENNQDDACLLPLDADEIAPPDFLDRIAAAFENHARLRAVWGELWAELSRRPALRALVRLE
jgi:hypothetical protein